MSHLRALVFGRANNVWTDIKAAYRICPYFDMVVAVGRAGCDYPGPIDHWVSFHAELFPGWLRKREANGHSVDRIQFWTDTHGRKMTAIEQGWGVKQVNCNGGSSGMVAVVVAKGVGATKIILAGIPLEDAAGHYDETGPWDEAMHHRKIWERDYDQLKDVVRSMSGWTRTKFGEPTAEWLKVKAYAR